MKALAVLTLCVVAAMALTTIPEYAVVAPPEPGIPKEGTWSALVPLTEAQFMAGAVDLELWVRFTTWSAGRSINVTYYDVLTPSNKKYTVISQVDLTRTNVQVLSIADFPNCVSANSSDYSQSVCNVQIDFYGVCDFLSCLNGISVLVSVRSVLRGTSSVYPFNTNSLPYVPLIPNYWIRPTAISLDSYLYFLADTSALTAPTTIRTMRTYTTNIAATILVYGGGSDIVAPTKTAGNYKWVLVNEMENITLYNGTLNYFGVYANSITLSDNTEISLCLGDDCTEWGAASTLTPLLALFAALFVYLF